MKYLGSYGTILFDTLTGDLEVGQYADSPHTVDGKEYYSLLKEEVQAISSKDMNIGRLTKVNILSGIAYWHRFQLDDGSIVKKRIIEKEYTDRATIKSYPEPIWL